MSRTLQVATLVVLALGAGLRLLVLSWDDPWGPHHPDEVVLPLEAVALWEGVTPRDLGWPASTTRLALSTAAASVWTVQQGPQVWEHRSTPATAMAMVSEWIGHQYVDRTQGFRLGRLLSLLTGIAQLLVTVWAARRWFGPRAALWAAIACAVSPVAVTHSQYVLADIQGLLFATFLVGLAATPTRRGVIVMAALAGLAAASKFHFAFWILTPLMCTWLLVSGRFRTKLLLTFAVLATWLIVFAALVPWIWTNPLLVIKEFAAVVLLQAGATVTTGGTAANVRLIMGALGSLTWCGAIIGLIAGRQDWRRLTPIGVPLLLCTFVVVGRSIVFDRYALLLLPAGAVLAGRGWAALTTGPGVGRLLAALAIGLISVDTIRHTVAAERYAADVDVDVEARRWVLDHVPRGTRVAVHDESVAPLPRSATQLHACIQRLDSPEAYREKWRLAGVELPTSFSRSMEAAIVNDERYYQYWCLRELQVTTDQGFRVVTYHADPHFWAVREADVIDDFRTGGTSRAGGIDVLVLNRTMDVGTPPAAVIDTRRGRRVIYERPVVEHGAASQP